MRVSKAAFPVLEETRMELYDTASERRGCRW
jgi:hypothetical protein